jgi:peptide/nickel transport system substrate-binding protein
MPSLLISCALVVLAAGCSRPSASAPAVARRGEFRVVLPSKPASLNPNLQLDESAFVVARSLFSQLLTINESGRLLPELAESWAASPDGLTYTFKLRRNVRWHDGRPCTSADVQWTFAAIAKDGYAKHVLAPVASVSTPDVATVVITLKHPWAPFASDLAGPGLSVLPRHVYERGDWHQNPANQRPIGTGPFRFGRWDGDALVLEAATDYFRSGPFVERVRFIPLAGDAVGEALQRGDVDYAVSRPGGLGSPTAPVVVRTLPSSARYYIAVNLRRAPFDDVHVRRALASVVDRLEIVRDALDGIGAPAVGWYTPDVEWAYNENARVPDMDLREAARLLDAAALGTARGERLRTTLVIPNTASMNKIAEVLRKQFARIGITVVVERVPSGEFPTRLMVGRNFDLAILAGAQGPDPDQLRQRFLADTATGAFIGYSRAEFRDAVERGARATDLVARASAYHRAQEVLAEDVPFIPLVESVKVVVHHRRVSGLPQLEARGLVGGFDFSLVKLQ